MEIEFHCSGRRAGNDTVREYHGLFPGRGVIFRQPFPNVFRHADNGIDGEEKVLLSRCAHMAGNYKLTVFSERKSDIPGKRGKKQVVFAVYRDDIEPFPPHEIHKLKKRLHITHAVTRQGMHRDSETTQAAVGLRTCPNREMNIDPEPQQL